MSRTADNARRLVRVAAIWLVAGACNSSLEPPTAAPWDDGFVRGIFGSAVFVRADTEECGTLYAIGAETRIIRESRNGNRSAEILSGLRVGERAKAWGKGVIDESCPGQTLGDVILVLSE